MNFFCLPHVKDEIEKLSKKTSYKNLKSELFNYFDGIVNGNASFHGTRLNCSSPNPFFKKRIEGRGGFRIYYYVILVRGLFFLTALHPKSGKNGKSNLSKAEIKSAQLAFKNHYESGDYFKILLDPKKKGLKFEKNSSSPKK